MSINTPIYSIAKDLNSKVIEYY